LPYWWFFARCLPILGFPPCSVNSEALGLDVFIDCSEPSCSWTSGQSPLVSGWTERGGYDALVFALYSMKPWTWVIALLIGKNSWINNRCCAEFQKKTYSYLIHVSNTSRLEFCLLICRLSLLQLFTGTLICTYFVPVG